MHHLTRRTVATPARLAVAALSLFTATACGSSEEPQAEHPDDYVCDIASGSPEDKILRHVLRADTFTTLHGYRTPKFLEHMRTELREQPGHRTTYSVRQCSFFPDGRRGMGQANIDYMWSPLSDAKSNALVEGTRSYALNEATGTSNDVSTHLYVPCALPDTPGPAKGLLLHAEGSFTVNLGAVKDHGTQDQQMEFVYRMTRRAAEALGCQNGPLKKTPLVTPLGATTNPPIGGTP
ncbi:hypothetical protein ACIRSU_13155 [Streptomyces sp. NPDC101160]|uniref:hypothetical protein n=1 Tax=Streptomyces sp. NPDC101160 TaxID=3366118 RepID=UPI0038117BFA